MTDEPGACRNCGARAEAAFCPVCGQETRIALPTAPQFLREAAGRFIALDGRLWRTLAALLFRPGFLTLEYFAGRRRRYVRPARLFLALSLVVFAALRLTLAPPRVITGEGLPIDAPARSSGALADADEARRGAARPGGESPDLRNGGRASALEIDDDLNLTLGGPDLPLMGELRRRIDRFNRLPQEEKAEQLFVGSLRYGPYAMFVLLPAFALLLQLVYLGRRRTHPRRPRRYAEHLVFAAHNHAFVFAVVTLGAIVHVRAVGAVLAAWTLGYGFAAMRRVYGGRWAGVLARAALLGATYGVLFAVATAALVVAAIVLR